MDMHVTEAGWKMMLSVIIPVLNEAPNLERLLPDLPDKCPGAEVIVVDGGSTDGTLQVVGP
jgi:glycosyltransferase involved in cell wall biosynthesis